MLQLLKRYIRSLSIGLRLDLTQNLRYDRLTNEIIRKVLRDQSNCIDVGCHKGELLEDMVKYAPSGSHFAFEPLPHLYSYLKDRFAHKATILPYALSNSNEEDVFHFVENMPAYSGLQRRSYDGKTPHIQQIKVMKRTLDSVIPSSYLVDFMKIDVEGGEMEVLKGAVNLIQRSNPIILFECGLGANDHYGYNSAKVFETIHDLGLKLFTLDKWLEGGDCMDLPTFEHLYNHQIEYYFIAHK